MRKKKMSPIELGLSSLVGLAYCAFAIYAKHVHLFAADEVKKYYEVDESKDYQLYYEEDKLLTADDVSRDFNFVAEGNELGEDGYWKDVAFDKYYRVITKDGINYLVDADNYSNIRLYGFKELGKPFYLMPYDQEFGGIDTKGDASYSGYVLPYEDEQGNLCLVDLDSFEPLLMGVSLSEDRYSTPEYLTDQSHILLRNYLENRINYFGFYDAANGGIDEPGEYSGCVVYFNKGDHTYLVDLNDFSKVIVKDYNGVVYPIDDGETVGLKYVNKDDQNVQCIGPDIQVETTDELVKKYV